MGYIESQTFRGPPGFEALPEQAHLTQGFIQPRIPDLQQNTFQRQGQTALRSMEHGNQQAPAALRNRVQGSLAGKHAFSHSAGGWPNAANNTLASHSHHLDQGLIMQTGPPGFEFPGQQGVSSAANAAIQEPRGALHIVHGTEDPQNAGPPALSFAAHQQNRSRTPAAFQSQNPGHQAGLIPPRPDLQRGVPEGSFSSHSNVPQASGAVEYSGMGRMQQPAMALEAYQRGVSDSAQFEHSVHSAGAVQIYKDENSQQALPTMPLRAYTSAEQRRLEAWQRGDDGRPGYMSPALPGHISSHSIGHHIGLQRGSGAQDQEPFQRFHADPFHTTVQKGGNQQSRDDLSQNLHTSHWQGPAQENQQDMQPSRFQAPLPNCQPMHTQPPQWLPDQEKQKLTPLQGSGNPGKSNMPALVS